MRLRRSAPIRRSSRTGRRSAARGSRGRSRASRARATGSRASASAGLRETTRSSAPRVGSFGDGGGVVAGSGGPTECAGSAGRTLVPAGGDGSVVRSRRGRARRPARTCHGYSSHCATPCRRARRARDGAGGRRRRSRTRCGPARRGSRTRTAAGARLRRRTGASNSSTRASSSSREPSGSLCLRRPRANLALARAGREVRVGFLVGHERGEALDAHLPIDAAASSTHSAAAGRAARSRALRLSRLVKKTKPRASKY